MSPLRYLLILVLLAFLAMPVQGRELAVPAEEMLRAEVATLGLSAGGAPVVLLREPDSRRIVPIVIGPAEAQAIIRARENIPTPRPMTHDLFGPLFEALDVTLEAVYVDELANGTFMGALELSLAGQDEPILIDSRPSDALAIAARLGGSIRIAPDVLEAAADIEFRGLEDEPVTALGITVDVVTDDLREALELGDQEGVLITEVSGEAADKGLEPGDLVLSVNDQKPDSPMHFLELVGETESGEKARLSYWQAGEEHSVELDTDVPEPSRPQIDTEGGISL